MHLRFVGLFNIEQRGEAGSGGARAFSDESKDLWLGEVTHSVQEIVSGGCCGGGGGA